MLIVMGDHGQTLNGDHGGGTPEEVETSIFAMRMHSHVGSIPSKLDASDCKIAMDGRNDICIGCIPQLDFAVTMAALIGVPFPFGSVGRVNPELYALGAGPWPKPSGDPNGDSSACLNIQKWMEHYTDVMCINSWQLSEGGVANFLLASTGVLTLQSAVENESMVFKALLFLILNTLLGVIGVNGVSKETVIHPVQMTYSSTIFYSISMHFAMTILAAVLPLFVLIFLVTRWLRVKRFSWDRYCLYSFYAGGILSYILILVHWILEDITFMPSISLPNLLKDASRLLFPRLIYFLTAGLTVFLFYKSQSRVERVNSTFKDRTTVTAVAMLSVWSSTILLLLGKQGPLILLLAILQGWCILELQNIVKKEKELDAPKNELWSDPLPVIQWSLLAVQLFFCTGHSCTFDGLRYAAAFIGFDNFNIIRQGVLLVIDTFGVSHILPIFGLPLLVSTKRSCVRSGECDLLRLVQVFLIYGLVSATMATLSTVCVTIQRRHLMVWGLFAPKYVFEVIGLLLTDSLIVVAALYYF